VHEHGLLNFFYEHLKLNPMDLSNIKAVVFDLDGTLYDSHRLPMHLILGDLRHALTLRAERRARHELAGRDFESPEALIETLFRDIAAQRKKLHPKQVERWYLERYMPLMVRVLRRHYQARPQVRELVTALRDRGVQVAVFSDYGTVADKLRAIRLEPELFDQVFDALALGGLKPSARTFRRVAEALQVAPSEILMVGDRLDTDGAGAQATGMQFVHLLTHKKQVPAEGIISLRWEQLVEMLMR
jgi:HAD superfamily hydrolase (TIGR01549 family)